MGEQREQKYHFKMQKNPFQTTILFNGDQILYINKQDVVGRKRYLFDNENISFFILFFILNSLFTVAPSTKGGCFSGGNGKNLITMLLKENFTMLN